ncbi:TolC family protein [Aneurinibacillus sp. REN35]|uniref:TolC family protein n=1 Tax=Aneurinibacillus sp. REN35 TaxID=3237286 RepID=UPI0035280CC2
MKKLPTFLAGAFLASAFASTAFAADTTTLTYQQAIERALDKSYSLQKAEVEIERSLEVRNKLGGDLTYTPTSGGDINATKAYAGVQQADIGWQMSKRQYTLEQDKIAYSVHEAYNTILQAIEDKKAADISVENAYTQVNATNYKYMYGLASNFENERAQKTYVAAQKTQKSAETALTTAYQKLNELIKLPANERPTLTDKVAFEKMPEVDLEAYITRVNDQSPQLWLAEKNIDVAISNLNLHTFNLPGSVPYSSKELEVDKTMLEYSDAKDKVSMLVRALYNNIRQIEDNYDALKQNLAVAEQAFKLAQTQFDVGLNTKAELMEAKKNVEDLEAKLHGLAVQHDNLVLAFKMPWAYAAK